MLTTSLIVGGIISVLLNGLLLWYVYKLLAKLLYTSDNFGDLYIVFRSFEEYLSSLFKMDMFYGEPVLEELIKRTKAVRTEIERFEEIYILTNDVEMIEEEIDVEYNFEEEEEARETSQEPLLY